MRTRNKATAAASEEVEAAVVPMARLENLIRARPDIGLVLYRNLGRDLSRKLSSADRIILNHGSGPSGPVRRPSGA